MSWHVMKERDHSPAMQPPAGGGGCQTRQLGEAPMPFSSFLFAGNLEDKKFKALQAGLSKFNQQGYDIREIKDNF